MISVYYEKNRMVSPSRNTSSIHYPQHDSSPSGT